MARRRVTRRHGWTLGLLLGCAAGLSAFGVTTRAWAQPSTEDREAARELGKQGVAAFQAKRFVEALDKLSRAHEIVKLTTTGLWRARCLVELGRLVEAAEQYLEVTRTPLDAKALEQHKQAVIDAGKEREDLLPRIPQVKVVLTGGPLPSDVTASIDDKPLSAALIGVERPVDPGQHVLRATRGSGANAALLREERFEVAEGKHLELALDAAALAGASPLPPSPDPPGPKPVPVPGPGPTPAPGAGSGGNGGSADSRPSSLGPQAIGGFVLVAFGGAGLIAGTVMGAIAVDRKGALDAGCTDRNCPPDLHASVDLFYAMRTGATAALAVGGAVLLGGTALVLTAPADPGKPASGATEPLWRAELGLGSVALSGAF